MKCLGRGRERQPYNDRVAPIDFGVRFYSMEVKLQSPRFRAGSTPTGFQVDIPARRNWLLILFLGAWLGGWVFGEADVSKQLLNSPSHEPMAFMAFWIVGWTIGGALAITALLWQLAGHEVIDIDSSRLKYRVQALGIGRTRSYAVADVKELRSVTYERGPGFNQRSLIPPIFGSGYGPVAFDYGARTFRFGPSLDDAEAKMLVAELAPRLPRGSR